MKRWRSVIAWVILPASCASPPVSPVQEWAAPVRTEPGATAAREMFDQVVDGTFSFDDEAFYWLCAHARSSAARQELLAAASESSTPIRQLMERPADFRGRPVVVEGVLRSREEYEIRARPELGRLTQLELSVPGSHAIVTIVCMEQPARMPIGLPVRATGYFLKSRMFRTADGQSGAGVVVVTNGMVSVASTSDRTAERSSGVSMASERWVVLAVAVLLVAWLGLRRRVRQSPRLMPAARDARTTSDTVGANDRDFEWMHTSSTDQGAGSSHRASDSASRRPS